VSGSGALALATFSAALVAGFFAGWHVKRWRDARRARRDGIPPDGEGQ